jgi:hypothetical protein
VAQAVSPQAQPQQFGQQTIQTPYGQYRPKPTGYERVVPAAEKEKEAELKVKGETIKEMQKKKAQFGQAISMFKGMVSQVKGAEEEQAGLGIIPGVKGLVGEKLKQPGYGRVASAYGQRVETAARMNSILTGQNRVIKSVIGMIMKSLPDRYDTAEMAASKVAQSVTNAYRVTKAFEKAGLTPNELNKMSKTAVENIDANDLINKYALTPEENSELETIINDVLSAPVAKKRTLIGPRGKGIKSAEPKTFKHLWE